MAAEAMSEAAAHQRVIARLRDHAHEIRRLVAGLDEESLSRRTNPEYANYHVNFQMDYLVHHEAHHMYQMLQRRTPFGKIPHEP